MVRSSRHRLVCGWLLLAMLIGLLAGPAPATAAGIAYESTVWGGAASSATVATSSPVAAATGQLYLAAVATRPGSVSVRSVSGLGLTWTPLKAQCAGRSQTRIEVWQAIGTPAASGVVTTNLSGAATNAVIAVSRYSGVDTAAPLGALVSANTQGIAGSCSGGTDSPSYSVNMTTGAPGAVIYAAVAMRNKSHTPGNGYTERAELKQGSGSEVASVAIEDRLLSAAAAAAVDGTFSAAVDWALIVIEIRPGGTSPGNHAPVAYDGSGHTQQGTPLPISLSATDPDGDPLTYRVIAPPTNGALSGSAPNLTYTPNPAFSGNDAFSFAANDGRIDTTWLPSLSPSARSANPPQGFGSRPRSWPDCG